MKLRVEQQPDGYTTDRIVMLADKDSGEFILISCPNAAATGRQIAHRVNMHEPLIAGLEPFRSTEMGNLLVDALVAACPKDKNPSEVERRLRMLVNAIDMVLKGEELFNEREKL